MEDKCNIERGYECERKAGIHCERCWRMVSIKVGVTKMEIIDKFKCIWD